MASKVRDIRLFFGEGGQGKSTLIRHQLKNHKRIIQFDRNLEDEYEDGAVICYSRAELVAAVNDAGKPFRVTWRGHKTDPDGAFEFANRVAMAVRHTTLVWDEADLWIGKGKLGKSPLANELINACRHYEIKIFASSRRPACVPRDLTANASRLVVFMTSEPADLKYCQDYIGKDLAAKLPDLQPFTAIEGKGAKKGVKKSPFA